jgi:FMN phosphatase YigB (HAD superfamily)
VAARERLGLPEPVEQLGHLDACVVSGSVGVRKPDPRIYRLAVEASGAPEPPIRMVGDAYVDVGAR